MVVSGDDRAVVPAQNPGAVPEVPALPRGCIRGDGWGRAAKLTRTAGQERVRPPSSLGVSGRNSSFRAGTRMPIEALMGHGFGKSVWPELAESGFGRSGTGRAEGRHSDPAA